MKFPNLFPISVREIRLKIDDVTSRIGKLHLQPRIEAVELIWNYLSI